MSQTIGRRSRAADPAQFPADQQPDAEWWRAFGNDELTSLIERALQQNHDVKRAVARVLEGRAAVMSATAGLYPQVNLQGSYSSLAVSKNTLAGLGLARGGTTGAASVRHSRQHVQSLERIHGSSLGAGFLGPHPPRRRSGARGSRRE
jgi:outer membrane protein TolC